MEYLIVVPSHGLYKISIAEKGMLTEFPIFMKDHIACNILWDLAVLVLFQAKRSPLYF